MKKEHENSKILDLSDKNRKISTGIYGLDQILYGGIQLYPQIFELENFLSVVIRGGNGTSRALLGMQLLHGITKSLEILEEKSLIFERPYFISDKNKENLDDMLLDFFISKSIKIMMEQHIIDQKKWQGNTFAESFFEMIPSSNRFSLDYSKLDKYIAEETVVYNSRMNTLEIAFPYKTDLSDNNASVGYTIAKRKESIQKIDFKKINALLPESFYPVKIVSKDQEMPKEDLIKKKNKMIPCIVTEPSVKKFENLKPFYEKSLVSIFIVNKKDDDISQYNPDIIFEMRSYEDEVNKYFINQIRVSKSAIQTTALGWHQYKKRDYGIEIYPSLHLLLQRRRHMPKGILRSSNGILNETFQQYIDDEYLKEDTCGGDKNNNDFLKRKLDSFKNDNEEQPWERLNDLYQSYNVNENIGDMLEQLFIKPLDENSGRCTAIIGSPNTYKRFLILGGTFSACSNHIHTLDILMEKDDSIMRKRMICPAMSYNSSGQIFTCTAKKASRNCKDCNKCRIPECYQCYKYIHFKNIRMGYISPEEFIYYILKQLSLLNGNDRIKRIIIDDLQMIDYSFPLLKQDKLFLTALISICKENNIDLFILCDKDAFLANELRFLADNVVCTNRSDKGIRFFIERYSGYNEPSHIYGCKVTNVNELFYCKSNKSGFGINLNRIIPIRIDNLNEYWNYKQ